MMTSQVVRVLEARGMITRAPDPTDARVKRLTITDTGRRRAEQAITIVEAVDADFFSAVRDQGRLLEVVHRLAGDQGPGAPAPTTRRP